MFPVGVGPASGCGGAGGGNEGSQPLGETAFPRTSNVPPNRSPPPDKLSVPARTKVALAPLDDVVGGGGVGIEIERPAVADFVSPRYVSAGDGPNVRAAWSVSCPRSPGGFE